MGDLGYGTREPFVDKLKQLADDIQSLYEEFLDVETLYQQGKISDNDFFKKMGSFLKAFSSLGFLTVKVVVEINKTIGKDDNLQKPEGVTRPSATYRPEMMSGKSTAVYSPTYVPAEEQTTHKVCSQCSANIPVQAKFCTKCGTPQ